MLAYVIKTHDETDTYFIQEEEPLEAKYLVGYREVTVGNEWYQQVLRGYDYETLQLQLAALYNATQ